MRQICTIDHPMPKDDKGFWEHPSAVDIGECLMGCCDYYECLACGLKFKVEVAQ